MERTVLTVKKAPTNISRRPRSPSESEAGQREGEVEIPTSAE